MIRLNYDIDTSIMDPGVTAEVHLQADTGSGMATVATKYYQSGQTLLNESLTDTTDYAAGTPMQAVLFYSHGLTPPPSRQATLNLHNQNHHISPGIQSIRIATARLTFNRWEVYPAGTLVRVVVTDPKTLVATGFEYTVDPAGGDQQGEAVAAGVAALIDASPDYASWVESPTDTEASLDIQTAATVSAPYVSADVVLDASTTFYSADAGLESHTWVGYIIENLTDGSKGTITDNGTYHIITSGLAGGSDNTFQKGDLCCVVGSGLYFVCGPMTWNERQAGDMTSVPFPSFVGNAIDEVFFYQNRLGFTSGENVVLSRSGDVFNFFRQTATDLLADDVIDIKSSSKKVAQFDSAVEWNGSLYLFSGSGDQFELSGDPVLSPTTVRLDHASSYPASRRIRPRVVGQSIYFAKKLGPYSRIMEYSLNEYSGKPEARDITGHVPSFILGDVVSIVGDPALGVIAVLASGYPNTMYVYSSHHDNDRLTQESWSSWTFGGSVYGLDMHEGVLSLLIQRGTNPLLPDWGVYLESIDIVNPPNVVNGGGFEDRQGWTTTEPYTFRYTFSPLFFRDSNDNPETDGRLQLRYGRLSYTNSHAFTVTVSAQGRPDKTYTLDVLDAASGIMSFPIHARNTAVTLTITNATGRSCTFTGLDWEGYYTTRSRRMG